MPGTNPCSPGFLEEVPVQTSASKLRLDAVLSQLVGDEEYAVVSCWKLILADKNYAIVEEQCHVIKWALERSSRTTCWADPSRWCQIIPPNLNGTE